MNERTPPRRTAQSPLPKKALLIASLCNCRSAPYFDRGSYFWTKRRVHMPRPAPSKRGFPAGLFTGMLMHHTLSLAMPSRKQNEMATPGGEQHTHTHTHTTAGGRPSPTRLAEGAPQRRRRNKTKRHGAILHTPHLLLQHGAQGHRLSSRHEAHAAERAPQVVVAVELKRRDAGSLGGQAKKQKAQKTQASSSRASITITGPRAPKLPASRKSCFGRYN